MTECLNKFLKNSFNKFKIKFLVVQKHCVGLIDSGLWTIFSPFIVIHNIIVHFIIGESLK